MNSRNSEMSEKMPEIPGELRSARDVLSRPLQFGVDIEARRAAADIVRRYKLMDCAWCKGLGIREYEFGAVGPCNGAGCNASGKVWIWTQRGSDHGRR